VRERCHYPSFSGDPKEAFLGLAHDLAFADDFLTGTGALLRQAAKRESSDNAERNADRRHSPPLVLRFYDSAYRYRFSSICGSQNEIMKSQLGLRCPFIAGHLA
jgi:hypothetical protein